MPVGTYLEAIREALFEEMQDDETVFVMGEDIGVYGGAFKVTDGMLETFGDSRVIDTPIAEAGIVGAGVGAALMGRKPVLEIQFLDFLSCGFDMLTNFAAKCHYRWGAPVPIVVRGPGGGGVGGGPFHSQSMEMYFVNTPGIKVVAPSTPSDAKLLLKAAIRDPNPVLFIEHKALYRNPHLRESLPNRDDVGIIGQARVYGSGTDVVLFTYGAMVHNCLEVQSRMQSSGINIRVVDLRTLQPLDDDCIRTSVQECGKVLIVHEDTKTGGIAGEITARINEFAFEWLDAPVRRVTAIDAPIPFNKNLERAFFPQIEQIELAVQEMVEY